MQIETFALYECYDDVTLTAYILDHSPEMMPSQKRPALLICPGGGYMNCSDREAEPVALRFNAMGYHAFVLRYSTNKVGRPGYVKMEDLTVPPSDRVYPKQMQEIGMAMGIIRDNSIRWNVDADRIALCGFSAGAHNCAMYGANWHRPIITDVLQRPVNELRPAACILGYCVSDYVFMKTGLESNPGARMFFDIANMSFMGIVAPEENLLDAVSPNRHVTEHMPPTFLWSTANDNMVPIENTLLMSQALAKAKVPFEVHIFEDGPHGMSLATQATAGCRAHVDANVAKWVDMAESWLAKRLALQLPEEPEPILYDK